MKNFFKDYIPLKGHKCFRFVGKTLDHRNINILPSYKTNPCQSMAQLELIFGGGGLQGSTQATKVQFVTDIAQLQMSM